MIAFERRPVISPPISFIESDNEPVPESNLGILFILFLYLKSMML
nr:MAG TPA: hypothetical protein [Caudoviricetes sp.]